MTEQIKYNTELELGVPTGDILEAIVVDVVITPPNGSVLIYGMSSPNSLQPVKVDGSQEKVELPFINGHVYVTYLGNTSDCHLAPRGYRDSLK